MKALLEVCCGSAEDAIEAYRAGARRVELCSCLFQGGLTPTPGSLLTVKAQTDLSVMAMVRPREGGFCYTETEFSVAVRDAELLLQYGADGLVFGFLHEDGTVDIGRTGKIASMALRAGKQAVFHRAFDVVPDWRSAMDALIGLGITRILTSGQEGSVSDGADTVREMIAYAAGRVTVMPGGGITEKNVERILRETGCTELHLAAHKAARDPSAVLNPVIHYGGCLYPPEDLYNVTDRERVAGILARL